MSLYSDADMTKALSLGWLEIDPLDPSRIGPASYDVTLSRQFRVPDRTIKRIDLAGVPAEHTKLVEVAEGDGFIVRPGECLLGSTTERVGLGDGMAARYEGRSSLGRLFLSSHITAGFIDPGFVGNVTLEIVNHSPWELVLRPGMRIGQLCFFSMRTYARRPYAMAGHYQHQQGPVESRFRL